MASFYGWGSTTSTEPIRGDSLRFTTKYTEISGTICSSCWFLFSLFNLENFFVQL